VSPDPIPGASSLDADDPVDVLVLGAGPAGATAARAVRRTVPAARVVLVDRERMPRPKVCGCCVGPLALAALAEAGLGDLPTRHGAIPLRRIRLRQGERILAFDRSPRHAGVVLSRERLDAALVGAAVADGVRFVPETHVRFRPPSSPAERLLVEARRRRAGAVERIALRPRVVIDARGLAAGGGDGSRRPRRIGAGAISADAAGLEPGVLEMSIGAGGYLGRVRLEDDRTDLAAALDRGEDPPGSVATQASMLLPDGVFDGTADLRWRGTPPLRQHPAMIAGPGWFRIGDAAGYVEPFTGEGIGWAIRSGLDVVPCVAATLEARTDHAAAIAHAWRRRHGLRLGWRQHRCRAVADLVARPDLVDPILWLGVRLPSAVPRLLARSLTA